MCPSVDFISLRSRVIVCTKSPKFWKHSKSYRYDSRTYTFYAILNGESGFQ